MSNNVFNWYQSLPVFNNQLPRVLTSFRPNEKYEDDFFVTSPDSLIPSNLNIINRRDIARLNQVRVWKRISDLFPNYDLFPSQLNCDTFSQGDIDDCYFISMISLISNYGEMLTRLFPIPKNNHGYYEVILFINGWKRVIVDDYIPVITIENNFHPITCLSKKYENCFYHMLLEKAWAKVNKSYYNIIAGSPDEALLVLTGIHAESILFLEENRRDEYIEEMRNGIRKKFYLYGLHYESPTKSHAYSLLDVEQHEINNIKYQVLKIRDPYGKIGNISNLFWKDNDRLLRMQFQNNRKVIVEHALLQRYEKYEQIYQQRDNNNIHVQDDGIFFLSKTYFLNIFGGYYKAYFMSSNIEFLFTFNLEKIKKYYFVFKMVVSENSLIILNLTSQTFDTSGKIKFFRSFKIEMNPKIDDSNTNYTIDIGNVWKIPKGEYLIQWKYDDNIIVTIPDEILFWTYFEGKIDINFLGMSQDSQIWKRNFSGFNFNSNEGMNFQKREYELSKKLGLYYKRKANIMEWIERVLHCNINQDAEDKGFSLSYQENGNVAFSYIMNKEDLRSSRILSQNLDFPEFIFEGNLHSSRKIIGDGNIYLGDNIVYHGQINYNLFPQFVQENNMNRLIIDVEAKRFKLSQEINENELINITVRREGPFLGQIKKDTHIHALSKCITPYRNGWICDQCGKYYNTNINTFYCSVCDFDFCGLNCEKPNSTWRERPEHYYPQYHFKSLQHNHPLICLKLLDRNNHLKCFSCLQNISPENKLFYCTKCDFRLCEKCQIKEKKGDPLQFKTSWHEHPLTFCKTKGKQKEVRYNKYKVQILDDSEFFFKCNHCGIVYSRKKDSFYCTACDFYICMKCYKDYFFFIGRDTENALNVNMDNREAFPVLCKCFVYDENIRTINCKKCNVVINSGDQTYDAYYCSNCNSNFCNICYRSHKVLFQNNVLIFDGFFEHNRKNGFGISYKLNNDINFTGNWENGEFKLIKIIPHSHQLLKNSFDDGTQCDICLKLCDIYDYGISCSTCNFHICDKCIIKINSKLVNSSQIHNHDLQIEKHSTSHCKFCNLKNNKVYFTCNICNNCSSCNRNISVFCVIRHSLLSKPNSPFDCCLHCFLGKIQ